MDKVILTILMFSLNCYCIVECSKCKTNSTTVVIPQGKVKGFKASGGNYMKFLGIPYASVKRRFEAPGDPPKWRGTLNVSSVSIKCKQYFPPLKTVIGQEDCLILNIYTPISPDSTPDVMVFIHGGGLYADSSTDLIYDPKYLVKRNIVVVTINYRLGAFGFLCLGNKEVPGNAGLKDQIAALKWVKNNIAYFGGNPNSITVFGQGSGAYSINYLILSPHTKDLFNKAILQSGSVLIPEAFDDNPINSASQVAARMGYNSSDPTELLEIFENAEADEIIRASSSDVTNDPTAHFIFKPCVENSSETAVVTASPKDLSCAQKEDSNIKIIIGFNDKEGITVADSYNDKGLKKLNSDFSNILPGNLKFDSEEDKKSFGKEVKEFYFKNSTISKDTIENLIDFHSDSTFMYPIVEEINYLLNTPNITIYNYYFTFDSNRNMNKMVSHLESVPGASHGDELYYMFEPSVYQPFTTTKVDLVMINRITRMWAFFAKFGDPTPSQSQVKWEKSEKGKLQFLHLNQRFRMMGLPNKERIDFWTKAYEKYGGQ